MNLVRFLDVGATYRELAEGMDGAYRRVMRSGWYILGSEVEDFERAFAAYCGIDHAVGVGTGLDAIVLALRSLGVGTGDEVVVSAHTFIATWLAVTQVGAELVPVDADPVTMNIDVRAIEGLLTVRTKAILVVHLYGLPVDLEPIRSIAAARGIPIVEDAAQAHGATVRGRRAGSLGDMAAFSFYPGKNLGAFGDGGAVTTSSADLARRIREFGNYGSLRKYEHEVIGTNSRLDSLQAAFLSEKLALLDRWNRRRREIALRYLEGMRGLDALRLPSVPDGCESAWHLFVVRHPQRGALAERLGALGIETQVHYPVPNHHAGAYRKRYGRLSLPITEDICATCLSLPIGPHLTDADVDRVVDAVRAAAS